MFLRQNNKEEIKKIYDFVHLTYKSAHMYDRIIKY